MTKSVKILGWAALAGTTLLFSGCRTTESYRYTSTPHLPQTITMVDTSTGEQVWTVDIPVGQDLVFKFPKRPQLAEKNGFDEMMWTLVPAGDTPKGVQNRMRVPPPSTRRVEGTFRPGPEHREDTDLSGRTVQPTPAGVKLPDPNQPAPGTK